MKPHFSFMLIYFLACISPGVQAGNDGCEGSMQGVASGNPEKIHVSNKRPSVDVVGAVAGYHGGIRHLLKRRYGLEWRSDYESMPDAVQGDPRWFIFAVGEEVAKFFGFEMLSHDLMTAPDAAELAGAIRKVNEVLIAAGKEPIRIHFVDAESIPLTALQYAVHAARGEIPIARSGPVVIHDSSYHMLILYAPPPYMERARTRDGLLLALHDHWVQPKYEPNCEHCELRLWLEKLVRNAAANMDEGTAGFSLYLQSILSNSDATVLGTDFFAALNRMQHGSSDGYEDGVAGYIVHRNTDIPDFVPQAATFKEAWREFWATREGLGASAAKVIDPRKEPQEYALQWVPLSRQEKMDWVKQRAADINEATTRFELVNGIYRTRIEGRPSYMPGR